MAFIIASFEMFCEMLILLLYIILRQKRAEWYLANVTEAAAFGRYWEYSVNKNSMIKVTRTAELRQADYEKLYNKIEHQQRAGGLGESLLNVCSVELDRTSNLNQINLIFLDGTPLRTIKVIKKAFDIYSKDFSFSMNYPDISDKKID